MADIGSLIIKIGADASGLEKAFKQLGGSAQQFQRGLQSLGHIAADSFLAATTAAVAMTVAAGKQAEQLDQLSHVTGINTDKLQEYDVMLNRAGLDGQDLAQVMKNISTNLDQARQGTGTAADRFRQLGIDIRTVTNTDDLIRKVASAAGNFADGTAKAALMSDLLGKGWQTFIKAFAGGAKAFDDVRAASQSLGQTLSTTQIAALTKMDDKLDDLMTSMKRFGQQLAVFMAPSVELVVGLLKDLLAWGSKAFEGLSLGADLFAIHLTHLGLQVSEISSLMFSSKVFSGDAWAQTLSNLKLIGVEQDKLIAKAKAQAALPRIVAQEDTRKALPQMIDTSKESAQQQALLDAQLKAKESSEQNFAALASAGLANRMAQLDQEKAFGMRTDMEIAQSRQIALNQMDLFTDESIKRQISAYNQFVIQKRALFTNDQKGQADRIKFEEEANTKQVALANRLAVAQINADTTRIQSGLQVKTFFIQQLQDLAASNTFSTGQIVTAWTGGVANSIVNGGQFIKQAWKQTELAIVQGALNTAVQWAAKQALMVAQSLATSSAIVAINATKDATIVAEDSVAAGATVGIWTAAGTAIVGVFGVVTAAIGTFMTGVIIPMFVAIGEAIAAFLFGLAEAEADTIFGIPLAVATVGAAVVLLAAVGALAAFAFADGGIVKGPTMGMLGEAGSPEAVIPLNSKGASFMRSAFGGGEGGAPIHTHVYLDGRQMALAISDQQMSALRTMGTL